MTNISVGQIIMDVQHMAGRVKDLDTLGSALLVEAEGNNRLVESLRQFQNDIDSLNRISHNKSNVDMVNRIQQQNANTSEILKENRELKICIEDYERAMELIMQKYREHTTGKVFESKLNFKELYNDRLWKIIREQREKINEMAAVMQRAASVDDEQAAKEIAIMERLRLENKSLRELLQISKEFGSTNRQIRFSDERMTEKAVQTEADDSADELSLSGASVENANNNSAIQINVNNSNIITDNAPVNVNNNNEPTEAPFSLSSTDQSVMDFSSLEDPTAMPTNKVVTGNSYPEEASSAMNLAVETTYIASTQFCNSAT